MMRWIGKEMKSGTWTKYEDTHLRSSKSHAAPSKRDGGLGSLEAQMATVGMYCCECHHQLPPPSSNSNDEYDHHSSAISSHTHCAITVPPPSLPGGGVTSAGEITFLFGHVFTAGRAVCSMKPRR